jgi:hypothetical protein
MASEEPAAAPLKLRFVEAVKSVQASMSNKPTSFREQSAGPPSLEGVGPLATSVRLVFLVAAVVVISV